jgi:hypothetical protein
VFMELVRHMLRGRAAVALPRRRLAGKEIRP